ncbi:MAG TPA: putative porin, partial [Immundisolibacter sp.]
MKPVRPWQSRLARSAAVVAALLFGTAPALGDERADLEKLRATVTGLIGALVEQGVLSREAADGMIKKAEADAARTVAAQAGQSAPAKPGEVRVSYVPQFVKDE